VIVLDTLTEYDMKEKVSYYKDLFLSEKIIGVENCDLKNITFETLRHFLMQLTNCSTQEVIYQVGNQHFGQDRVDKSDSEGMKDFIYYNIHSDIANVAEPNLNICRLIGMKMDVFDCDPSLGKTCFLDREKMLEETPKEIREWMTQVQLIAFIGQPDHDGKYIAGEDYDGKIWPMRSMPAIITHPVTGKDNFAFTSYRYGLYGNDLSLEKEYREFVKDYLSDNTNWYEWTWAKDKMILWDNYNLLHTYSAGWKDDERVFTRLQAGFTYPFYRWKND
jgi:hypothetical protein